MMNRMVKRCNYVNRISKLDCYFFRSHGASCGTTSSRNIIIKDIHLAQLLCHYYTHQFNTEVVQVHVFNSNCDSK